MTSARIARRSWRSFATSTRRRFTSGASVTESKTRAVKNIGAASTIAGAHGPEQDPQLLDHRPHRPRQVDAGRPHPRDHRGGLRAGDARAAARLDGSRARARHHDQGPGGARLLEGPRAQPDRYAGARGLHLRGLPLAPGLRGRRPRRRRGAGDRGADAGERIPRDRERARDRPGREQDRPAAGGPRRCVRRGRGAARRRSRARRADLGEDRRERRPGARRGHRTGTRAGGRPGRATARARVRLVVRPVPRRRCVRARDRRHVHAARRAPRDGDEDALRRGGARLLLADDETGRVAHGRRGGLRRHRD